MNNGRIFLISIIFLSSCTSIAIGDKMFVRKIDKVYSFSNMRDSSLIQFKNKYGSDFVYKKNWILIEKGFKLVM
jgi:hypothetical protein